MVENITFFIRTAKLIKMIPEHILWPIIYCFSMYVYGHLSKTKSIGLSVVQGSGIGPVLYAVMKSDLQAISRLNTLFKYADDTSGR